MEFTYDLTVDPNAENNTHAFALAMIGHNKAVLEVGCATGYFTKVLVEQGCKVVGVEIDPEAAKLAEQWADRVVVGNVDDTGTWEQVDDELFDVVTFGDVLEHLQDPLAALRQAVTKLKPTGFIVTSVPNVAHGDLRLSLLRGSFTYRETGLLDRTHIRFFTLESIRDLLFEAGLVVVDTKRVIVPLFAAEFGLKRDDFPDAVLDEVRADSEFETYQIRHEVGARQRIAGREGAGRPNRRPVGSPERAATSEQEHGGSSTGPGVASRGAHPSAGTDPTVRGSHRGPHAAGAPTAQGTRRGDSHG